MVEENVIAGRWLRNSFFSLLLVALLGAVLRYKIAFPLPYIDQRNFLHAHSHFAFAGWISQGLMALIISRLPNYSPDYSVRKFRLPLWINLLSAYGMLLSFPFEGYGPVSIFFSNLQILSSIIFMFRLWKAIHISGSNAVVLKWFKAASFFNVFSALGAFSLAFMMATKQVDQHTYLGSVYFFLHFQYNGWFSFVVLGLLSELLEQNGIAAKDLYRIFYLFMLACIPAYGLSVMWAKTGWVVYILIVCAALLQFAGAGKLIYFSIRSSLFNKLENKLVKWILILSLIAFAIKILLQLGSTVPWLSKLAFGYRPIVIGYLHLVLLGFISLFIIGYGLMRKFIITTSISKAGLIIFICGIIANELMLCIEGLVAIKHQSIASANTILFFIALVMFLGILIFNLNTSVKSKPDHN